MLRPLRLRRPPARPPLRTGRRRLRRHGPDHRRPAAAALRRRHPRLPGRQRARPGRHRRLQRADAGHRQALLPRPDGRRHRRLLHGPVAGHRRGRRGVRTADPRHGPRLAAGPGRVGGARRAGRAGLAAAGTRPVRGHRPRLHLRCRCHRRERADHPQPHRLDDGRLLRPPGHRRLRHHGLDAADLPGRRDLRRPGGPAARGHDGDGCAAVLRAAAGRRPDALAGADRCRARRLPGRRVRRAVGRARRRPLGVGAAARGGQLRLPAGPHDDRDALAHRRRGRTPVGLRAEHRLPHLHPRADPGRRAQPVLRRLGPAHRPDARAGRPPGAVRGAGRAQPVHRGRTVTPVGAVRAPVPDWTHARTRTEPPAAAAPAADPLRPDDGGARDRRGGRRHRRAHGVNCPTPTRGWGQPHHP
ncbi:putative N5-carboxyaminoimidazole ribonucleotide synthase [Actinacidiphila bryophytorum]|uniref:N5-carboxyaminoimidazole ribonucleotide synthase n=1 Tax=Actinacidiphila bryophytorum TaxID=1436133 RepID=A0A9W4E779_9ACTN|nr:putative N5-carboxyaminoimidazole ribonucleotide synthase [Actinacidiphila bryophytorum]